MPVDIQAVLSLLPELFPGTQMIPLGRIRLNPDNPGPPPTEEQIQEMADNIAAAGLQNPVKVGPDKGDPLAPGVTLHPDNPRLRGDGQPWKLEDFNFRMWSGELRYLAFQRLQRPAIPGQVLNPTEEEAVIIARTDNQVRAGRGGWWEDYKDVERLIKANPGLTQEQVGAKLGINGKKVNRAIRLLPLLNPEARALIAANSSNSIGLEGSITAIGSNQNNGKNGISEIAASHLADLGPGTGLKPGARKEGEGAQRLWPYPAIPPETQDLVCRALATAIGHQMTEAQVTAMVEAIKAGTPAQDYVPSPPQKRAPKAKTAPATQEPVGVGTPVAATPASAPAPSPAPAPQTGGVWGLVGGILWKEIKGKASRAFHGVFPRTPGWVHSLAARFQKLGAKDRVWTVFLAAGVLLFLGNFLISRGTRFLAHLLFRPAYSGANTASTSYLQPSASQPALGDQRGSKGPVTVFLPRPTTGVETGAKPPITTTRSAKKQVLVKALMPKDAAAINQAPQGSTVPATVAKTIPAWAQDTLPAAGEFANHFYGIGYTNWDENLKYLKSQMVGDGAQTMVGQYFPASLQRQMEARALVQYYSAGQGPKVISGQGDSAEVMAQGTVTTATRAGRNSQTLSTKPVALLMTFRHSEGFGNKIEKVTEVEPMAQAPKKPQGDDLFKQIGDGVKDVSNAANTVNNTASAVDQAKKILGF